MIKKLQGLFNKVTSISNEPAITFDKVAIDNINLVRQLLRDEFDHAPNLQNPKLLEELIDYAYKTKRVITRSHIRKLMDSMGEPWISRYNKSNQRRIDESDVLK